MMIGFSTRTYDLNGALLLKGVNESASDIRSESRRVSRTRTLDGGAYLNDSGYTSGDKTLKIVPVDLTEEEHATLRYLLQNYSEYWVCCEQGAYIGTISDLSWSAGKLVVTVLVKGDA